MQNDFSYHSVLIRQDHAPSFCKGGSSHHYLEYFRLRLFEIRVDEFDDCAGYQCCMAVWVLPICVNITEYQR